MASLADLSGGYRLGGGGIDEAAAGRGSAIPISGGNWFAQFQPQEAGGIAGPAGGDWIAQALSQAQSTDDPNYWRRVIAEDPKVAAGDQSAIDYWKMRIAQGDGALATRTGQQVPYGANGGSSIGAGGLLASVPSQAEFEAMPGYQAALGAAQRGVERSAAAKGTLLSGGTMEDIGQRLSDIAAGNYLNFANLKNNVAGQNFGQFYNLAGLGLNANNAMANVGTSYGANSANLTTGQGNANAASTIAQGNTNANVINGLGNLGADLYDKFKNRNSGTGPIYGPGY